MAKVFNKNKAMNHFLWEFLAAFHKANPFQGKTQRKIKSIKEELIPIPAFKFKNESNIPKAIYESTNLRFRIRIIDS